MKRNLLAVLAIASSSLAFSQVMQRPLVEHFTQASCGPCASQNPTMQATLTAFGTANAVRVAHQVSWPGVDPMNASFPAGPDVRRNYYGVSGVPNVSLNGGSPGAPNTIVTAATLASAAQMMTPYDITVVQSWQDANTVDVTVTIDNTTGSAISDADRVFITMVENEVDYQGVAPGSNGETVFHNVMRQMYDDQGAPGATGGSTLGTIAANSTETISFTISSLPGYIADKAEITFAVYIQNNGSQQVYQAAKSEIVPIPGIVLVEASAASTAGAGYCDYSFTPGIEFTNNDSQTAITEVVAEYSIDGGTPVQETVTGINLTQGQSVSIPFAATTLNSGTSVVSYNIVSANGGQPWSSPLAVSMPDEMYSKLNANAVPSPVAENMETGALEAGTGYSRDLSTGIFDVPAGIPSGNFGVLDGPTYSYVDFGGFGNSDRAIRARLYSIAAGEEMNFIMHKVNLGATPAVTFSHAYRQYANEDDRLRVLVSTDCGVTWNEEFNMAGGALATLPAATAQYLSASPSDWRGNTVDLAAYANMDDVVIRFSVTSGFGNNMFIDDINIGTPNSITEESQLAVSVFPNPATDNFTVKLDEASNVSVQVIDLQGKVVASQNVIGQAETTVDVSTLASGIYTVLVSTENGVATKKVVVD
jgi:hypothetical protein